MNGLLKIFLSAMLIENAVLMRFLALCPFIGMSTDVKKSTGMGVAVLFVTVLATAVTYPLYRFVLVPLHLEFLQILTFILVIASLVQLVEFYLKKSAPALYGAMGVYLALITTNCAILAVTFDVITKGYTFVESLVYAVGTAAGFLLALLLLAGIREKIAVAPVPKFLRGAPILFISAALLSMSFGGFSGLIK
ncbi:MAG: electron transport complex subunit RsxA [Spirochaetes bacterium]|uniref:Ion-translocating oxidoreductase complex subunit A n=1 Tax=Candidatus Avitreponema avistercoris TaxID=2840705 RepID=A0A9D9ETD7_9SPIR|nr:electron transport complex subunit RsxA [Candidatus Avitreponema avistercoris]